MKKYNNENEFDIEFQGVTKNFGDVLAVDNVSLAIRRGSFFSFLGPSGCGKTTSLRLIAGFEQPTMGDVSISGQSVVGVPPYKRPVNMVFQNYSLFPHFDVADNVGYGLRQLRPRPGKAEISRRVSETLELVRLEGYENRRIWELSGGQQQRVALARALINRPTVLLLDEPLAALDRQLRQQMQIELQTLQRDVGITFLLVTHDQEEALSMSDSICIMHEGRVVQIGGPRELYDEPANHFVAGFIGKSNFFKGTITKTGKNGAIIDLGNGRELGGKVSKNATSLSLGSQARLAVRPELIRISSKTQKSSTATDVSISAVVKNRIFLGEQTEYLVETQSLGDILIRASKHQEGRDGNYSPGETVNVGWRNEAALAFEEDYNRNHSTADAVPDYNIGGISKGVGSNDQKT